METDRPVLRFVLTYLVILAWMAVLWQVVGLLGDPLGRARFWHAAAMVLQRASFVIGSAGLEAEKAYWRAIETARTW